MNSMQKQEVIVIIFFTIGMSENQCDKMIIIFGSSYKVEENS